ncbi:MAG: 4-hydroxy-tetrahydrodipicolinate reductase [Pirellulales bacterium]|nr:4-hydroxy-tetrahydrodipicolinate reductase [Pirellulales bacterium]
MGLRLVALGAADPGLRIVAALEHAAHPKLGTDAGTLAGAGNLQLPLSAATTAEADVMIDFSTPEGAERALELARRHRWPLVLATTGLEPATVEQLKLTAREIPLLWSPNTSLAVNVAMLLTSTAARALRGNPAGVDVEIIERHHRFKEDSPSGTALRFGQLVAAEMGQSHSQHGREGRPGARPRNEIGYHAVRIGDNPGEHTIVFGLLGETLEVTVKATSRDCYAHGALAAAKWLVGRPPGQYTMNDVLGLTAG